MKIILGAGLEGVQPALVASLFSKIPEYFVDDDENCRLDESIPRLILIQFKWIESIQQESKVTGHLLDLVETAPLHIKREAIAIIPEVAADDEHEEVVQRLRAQIDTDALCTNAVLDAFSNLTLHEELLCDVADKVMDLVRSAEANDLPVIVRYLVQSCSDTAPLAKNTVAALRNNLNFFVSSDESKASDQGQALTLDALRSGLKFRRQLVSALLEEIRKVDSADAHKPFDVWALIMLREIGEPKRQVEVDKLFKKKVADGLFKPGFMRESIANNSQALRPYFRQFCAVADTLMKSHDDGLAAFGTEVYQVLFEVFWDNTSRQEILGNIVTHIGGGNGTSIDAALDVFVHLALEHSAALRPFALFIKGILDYLDNLKPHHIRKLFKALSMISISGADGMRELDDDVTIYIRKLLSNPKLKYMQHGIIGAVSAVVALSTVSRQDSSLQQDDDDMEDSQKSALGTGIDQATQLLETVKSKCETTKEAGVFFYDELSSALIDVRAKTDKRIKASSLQWMNENLTCALEETYLDDLPDDESGCDTKMSEYCAKDIKDMHPTLAVRAELNLDGDNGALILNPVKLVVQVDDRDKLQRMCAVLRLVSTMEWATKDKLDEIDALAGCPIYMFEHGCSIGDFRLLEPPEQEQITLVHFYVCNWIIEVLNAFCLQPEDEVRRKMVVRTNNLIRLLQDLDDIQKARVVPLPNSNAAFDLDATGGASSSNRGRPKAQGKVKDAAKRAKGKGKVKDAAKTAKGKGKGKGKSKEEYDGSDSSSASSCKPSRGGKAKQVGSLAKGKVGEEEEEEEEEGAGSSEKAGDAAGEGAAASVANNGNKSKLHLASSIGFLTEFIHVRHQANNFRELDLTVHNVLKYNFEMNRQPDTEGLFLDDAAVLALLQDLWAKIDGIVAQRRTFPWAHRGGGQLAKRQVDPLVFFLKMQEIWPATRDLFESAAKRLGATEETMDVDVEVSQMHQY